MRVLCLVAVILFMSSVSGERVNSITTKVNSCLTCGMIEGLGYITVKVSSSYFMVTMSDPALSRCVAAPTAVCPGVWIVMASTGCQANRTSSRERKYNITQGILNHRPIAVVFWSVPTMR